MQEIQEEDRNDRHQVDSEIPSSQGGFDAGRLQQLNPDDDEQAGECCEGICSIKPANGSANSRTQKPCKVVEARVSAPASIFAELRTITPAIGRPPIAPEAMFEAPGPINSRLSSVCGPLCILSVATDPIPVRNSGNCNAFSTGPSE